MLLYVILKYLYDCLKRGKVPEFALISAQALGIPTSYWGYILEHAAADGFIEGLTITETKDGKLITASGIGITPKGIEYLFSNSTLSKVKNTVKDIKDFIPVVL